MTTPPLFFLLLPFTVLLVRASPAFPITASPPVPSHIFARQASASSTYNTICGYGNGDLNRPWKAANGFKCMVDTSAGHFGFCPLDFTDVKSCPMGRACIDSHSCTSGCGKMGDSGVETATCTKPTDGYCYTNLLVAGPSSTYSYVACDSMYRQATYSIASNVIPGVPGVGQSTSASATPSQTPALSQPTSSPASPSVPSPTISNTAVAAASSSSSSDPPKSASSDAGPIVGGILGGLAIVALAGLAFYYLRKRAQTRPPYKGSAAMKGFVKQQPQPVEADEKSAYYEMPAAPTVGHAHYRQQQQYQSEPVEMSSMNEVPRAKLEYVKN